MIFIMTFLYTYTHFTILISGPYIILPGSPFPLPLVLCIISQNSTPILCHINRQINLHMYKSRSNL